MLNTQLNLQIYKTLFYVLSFCTLVGSLVIMYYIDRMEKIEECKNHSPKQLDFIKKYIYFITASTTGVIVLSWLGFI